MGRDPVFPLQSYAAFGEDLIIAGLIGEQVDGFYVDVGCHLPIDFSNTYLLYLKGWRGIAIDPDPDAIAAFRRDRPRDLALQIAIGTEPGSTLLHRFSDSSMNTVDADRLAKVLAIKHKHYLGALEVERQPLAAVLEAHLPARTPIDIMNIDCEGADLDVIRSNDWSRFRPLRLMVEDLDLDLEVPGRSSMFQFLRDVGYHLESRLRLTSIYRRI